MNDCISREDTLTAFSDYVGSGMSMDDFDALWDIVAKMPSVTPPERTGHWIMSDDGLYIPICDKCGAHPWKGYIPTVKEATKVFKYCPNCGAKMESEAQS